MTTKKPTNKNSDNIVVSLEGTTLHLFGRQVNMRGYRALSGTYTKDEINLRKIPRILQILKMEGFFAITIVGSEDHRQKMQRTEELMDELSDDQYIKYLRFLGNLPFPQYNQILDAIGLSDKIGLAYFHRLAYIAQRLTSTLQIDGIELMLSKDVELRV